VTEEFLGETKYFFNRLLKVIFCSADLARIQMLTGCSPKLHQMGEERLQLDAQFKTL